jgi:hypothetical protein
MRLPLFFGSNFHSDALDLQSCYSVAIPKGFIHCRHDKALPPGYFYLRMSSRAKCCLPLYLYRRGEFGGHGYHKEQDH